MKNPKKILLISIGVIIATLIVIAFEKIDIIRDNRNFIGFSFFILITMKYCATFWTKSQGNKKLENELVEDLKTINKEKQEKILSKLTGARRLEIEQKLKK